MDKQELISQLQNMGKNLEVEIQKAEQEEELEKIRIQFLGKKGELTAILKHLGKLPPDDRAEIGGLANTLKEETEARVDSRKKEIADRFFATIADSEWLDVTAPLRTPSPILRKGRLHPITQIQQEIEAIFRGMGFQVLDGPEVETEYYNFTALNTPDDHPARDMQDTFWTEDGNLLRTHTSAIQIRGMEKNKPPFKVIGPGRVFRYETVDASHENTFYQVEGMMVDKDISVANLIYIMKTFLREIFARDVKVRLRPGYFPFVEPGFELDINCLICGGKGCPVCKQSGWVELLPCGLVHPNVLRYGGIDTSIYSGFAFGLGLNRLVMMRYGINDIRWFQNGDLRFIHQF